MDFFSAVALILASAIKLSALGGAATAAVTKSKRSSEVMLVFMRKLYRAGILVGSGIKTPPRVIRVTRLIAEVPAVNDPRPTAWQIILVQPAHGTLDGVRRPQPHLGGRRTAVGNKRRLPLAQGEKFETLQLQRE